ncbi:MAG: cation:proton antiporter [Bacteroidales bacterium]|nr:cation:proton antiporter [Bacteroidales bacterium]
MNEELNLVRDLAVILISAGIFTIICRALKQPSILGYIVAGFIISPNLGLFGISSMETVHQWSEIGIIFLMFGLGLEFSFKKLLSVGSSAITIAGSKFVGVFIVGFTLGKALGWTGMEAIFLAGLLSMSSTAVIIKSYNEMGLKNAPYAPMVFGDLIVEDMFAILLMVLLSTLAVSHRFAGGEMLFNLAKLGFFLVLWFVIGIWLIPSVLKRARAYINDEILLIVSIGLCFGMVTLANLAGFSSALGAFVIGSILAETVESEHIERLVMPIKDLFGAIFFISVGMMISPAVIASHWLLILLICIVVLICDTLFVGIGVLLSGGGLDNAVHAGLSLAMLGEFGFIIAGVGTSLGVMRDFIYPVIIAVSVITILVSPYMLRLTGPLLGLLRDKLPPKLLERVDKPVRKTRTSDEERSEWRVLLRTYITRVLLYTVVIIAIIICCKNFVSPLLGHMAPGMGEGLHNWLMVIFTLLVLTPFLYGLALPSTTVKEAIDKVLAKKASNVFPIWALLLLRLFLATGFILIVVESYIALRGWSLVAIVLATIAFIIASKKILDKYGLFERKFLENLNEKERMQRKKARENREPEMHSLVLDASSPYVGKCLKELDLRKEGLLVVSVLRGDDFITNPEPGFVFAEGDRIWLAQGKKKS